MSFKSYYGCKYNESLSTHHHDAFTRDQRQEFWHKEAKSFKPIVGNSNTRFEEGMTEEIKKICEYQNEFMAQGVLPKVAFDRARLEVL